MDKLTKEEAERRIDLVLGVLYKIDDPALVSAVMLVNDLVDIALQSKAGKARVALFIAGPKDDDEG